MDEFDAERKRICRAEVIGVSKEAYDTWLVSTTHGQERVNDRGEDPRLGLVFFNSIERGGS